MSSTCGASYADGQDGTREFPVLTPAEPLGGPEFSNRQPDGLRRADPGLDGDPPAVVEPSRVHVQCKLKPAASSTHAPGPAFEASQAVAQHRVGVVDGKQRVGAVAPGAAGVGLVHEPAAQQPGTDAVIGALAVRLEHDGSFSVLLQSLETCLLYTSDAAD